MDFLLRSSNGLNHIGARFIAQDDASCMSISAKRINSGGSVAGAHLSGFMTPLDQADSILV
jgi:hypothetical protein